MDALIDYLRAALFALAASISADPTMFISVTPDPMRAGQKATVCFDFKASGRNTPVELRITWTDASGVDTVEKITLSPENPCGAVTPPGSAVVVNIYDPSGTSEDYGAPVAE